MERQLKHAEKQMEHEMLRAQRVRAKGLQENDKQILKQAEQMELQALAKYERAVKSLDGFSSHIDKSSKVQAQSHARTGSVTDDPEAKKRAARPRQQNRRRIQRPVSRPRQRSGVRRFFRRR